MLLNYILVFDVIGTSKNKGYQTSAERIYHLKNCFIGINVTTNGFIKVYLYLKGYLELEFGIGQQIFENFDKRRRKTNYFNINYIFLIKKKKIK